MQNFIQVNWRPVLGGLALQFFFAAMILKWDVGQAVFEFLGNQVQTFLEFTNTGTKFVFGDKYTDHPFAMVVCNNKIITWTSYFFSVIVFNVFKIKLMLINSLEGLIKIFESFLSGQEEGVWG